MGPAFSLMQSVRSACARAQRGRLAGLRDRYVRWRGQQWKVSAVNASRGVVQLMPVADPGRTVKVNVDEFLSHGFRVVARPPGFRLAKALPVLDRAWAIAVGAMEPREKVSTLRDLATQATDDEDVRVIDGYIAAIQRGEKPKRVR